MLAPKFGVSTSPDRGMGASVGQTRATARTSMPGIQYTISAIAVTHSGRGQLVASRHELNWCLDGLAERQDLTFLLDLSRVGVRDRENPS